MKKRMSTILPLKAFAAMVFTGIMCLYMLGGFLYAAVSGAAFSCAIPFAFVLQGLLFSMLVSILRGVCFSDSVVAKRRFFPRFVIFAMSLLSLLAAWLFMFRAAPMDRFHPWIIAVGGITLGVIALSGFGEIYFRKTGERYTKALLHYKTER